MDLRPWYLRTFKILQSKILGFMYFPPLCSGLALYPRSYARGFSARKYKKDSATNIALPLLKDQ
jgi:hypothetical protein